MAWTGITFTFGSTLTSLKMTQLLDNITALAAGDAGAPRVREAARWVECGSWQVCFAQITPAAFMGGPGGAYTRRSTATGYVAATNSFVWSRSPLSGEATSGTLISCRDGYATAMITLHVMSNPGNQRINFQWYLNGSPTGSVYSCAPGITPFAVNVETWVQVTTVALTYGGEINLYSTAGSGCQYYAYARFLTAAPHTDLFVDKGKV